MDPEGRARRIGVISGQTSSNKTGQEIIRYREPRKPCYTFWGLVGSSNVASELRMGGSWLGIPVPEAVYRLVAGVTGRSDLTSGLF